jgi:hypothetical protein
MSAYNDMTVAIAGLKADSGSSRVESWAAAEQIAFGKPCFAYQGGDVDSEKKVYNLINDVSKIVFDGDFVTSNSITITVNGAAAAAVTFDNDHDDTADLVVAAVSALTGVECALDPADTNNRTFLIRTIGTACVASEAITGGSGQVTGTVTNQTSMVFVGISLHTQKNTNVVNQSRYETNEAVSVLYKGIVWASTGAAVNSEDDAYLSLSTGLFTATTTDMDLDCKFRSTTSGAGLVKIEVNGQVKPFTKVTWL